SLTEQVNRTAGPGGTGKSTRSVDRGDALGESEVQVRGLVSSAVEGLRNRPGSVRAREDRAGVAFVRSRVDPEVDLLAGGSSVLRLIAVANGDRQEAASSRKLGGR